ncbi:OmpA family protein [Thiothrix subterranea]|uniref:OmpA family protein n=1 Tax=Thiothrix subterranea TaxID=2735563 RepID=A0AA51MKM3_9GAMM|nr:OmpA family protein [Thiothrix subterranea]MDQ5769271.1 OmpA family protein [Thiothrix subterranea]WML86254.1 OmpA family protein [Thiothrix subterranea]
MDKNSACCCGALPAMWWWLLTLLGLPLLFFLMTGARQGAVETDLTTRSTAALNAAGMDWATVNLDQRGRDVQLNGMAASKQDQDAALKIVQGVYGVRDVQNMVEVAITPKTAPATASTPLQEPDVGITDQTAQAPAEPAASPADQTAQAPIEQAIPPAEAAPAPEQQAVMNCQQQLNDAMTGKTILFETNKSAIKRDSLALLDSLTGIIADCKDVIAGRGIQVSGHTDNVGNDAYNQNLSTQRADAVKDYLVKKGVDSTLIKSAGYGESKPIASNDSEAGRSQNRRITFDINPE